MDETKQSFKEWVDGAIALVKPWKVAFIVSNICWAIVLSLFIYLAYMSPDTSYQYQDFESSVQTQSDGQFDSAMAPNNG